MKKSESSELNNVYVEKARMACDSDYTVYISPNGGRMRTGVFTGPLSECLVIACAYVAIGFNKCFKMEARLV